MVLMGLDVGLAVGRDGFEGDCAANNGAKVKTDDENDDSGFAGSSCIGD